MAAPQTQTQEAPPARSKPQELYGRLHLGMDHVLAKLLLQAPPLPAALKLQTETQSLATTWVQVSEAFEKRRAMLQRRKAKAKAKAKSKDKKDTQREGTRKKEKTKKKEDKKKKSSSVGASPRSGRSSPSVKADKKSQKKKKTASSPRVVKLESDVKKEEQPDAYQASVLKKLRRQPMCESVAFGSNKHKIIVKWLEVDQGKGAGTSPELMRLLTRLQLDATADKNSKPKLTRKRSLETLDDTLRAENRGKRRAPSSDRRRSQKQRKAYVDEDEVVYESGEEEEEPEYKGGYSDSDEAEFMPELENSPPPEKPKKRAAGRSPKRQRKQVAEEKESKEEMEVKEEPASKTGMTSMEQLAAVVAKIRADDVASGKADTKYLSYEEKKKPEKPKPGATSKSAIVLDDSDEEEEEEEEVEDEEEETKDADSSTDDDQDMFDLNEEDVYVVEAILCVKEGRSLLTAGGQRAKDADLYLVKWESYDELTWEPDENIPRRLIEMFRTRERAKRSCQYQIKVAHERRVVTNVTTGAKEIIYLIQWINQETPVWESRTTLPIKTQVWLDKVLGVKAPATKRRDTKAVKQYIYQ
ncbi:Chromodomain protein [Phytophthora cinnamomi]|uniref:Chromodomain protein n=1 Tax=Phytophthora cinnamomi TaxID=4785 RepID=UPI00355A3CD7|nr:Chromodomain protein [Phytophthora cinnamomi]